MTVGELIEDLKKFPPELPVVIYDGQEAVDPWGVYLVSPQDGEEPFPPNVTIAIH